MNIKKLIYLGILLTTGCSFIAAMDQAVALNPIAQNYFVSCDYSREANDIVDSIWCTAKFSYIQKFAQWWTAYSGPGKTQTFTFAACSSCVKKKNCTKLNENNMVGQYQNPSGTGYCLVWTPSADDYTNVLS